MSRNAYINKDIPLSKIHEVKADTADFCVFPVYLPARTFITINLTACPAYF